MKDTKDTQTIDAFPRKRGRPRKYASDAERVRAWRERKRWKESTETGGRMRKEFSLALAYGYALDDVAKAEGISQSELLATLLEESGLMERWRKLHETSITGNNNPS